MKKRRRTTHQAQNNVYFSLSTRLVIRVLRVGRVQWETQQAEANPTVKTQASGNHSIFHGGQWCPARSGMSRASSEDAASSLCISGL